MITTSNYFNEVDRIGVNTLPETLKKSHEYIVRSTDSGNNWKNYHNSETIKRVIDLHIQKVNEFVSASGKGKREAKPVEYRITAKVPEKTKSAKATQTKPSPKKLSSQKTAKKVERIREEVKFVKRYVGLHNKTKSPSAILGFIKALQRAIIQKLIQKTSPLAKDISMIQDKLVQIYNKMKGDQRFEINSSDLNRLVAIAGGEQVYPSINIIKRFVGLQGKSLEPDTLKRFLKQIENSLDKKKVTENDPYVDKVKGIYNVLKKKHHGEKLAVSKAELNGLGCILSACSNNKELGKIYRTNGKKLRPCRKKTYSDANRGACSYNKGLSGVLTAEEMANRKLDLLHFVSFWLALFGMPAKNFTMMFHGEPHNGKTIFLLKFAQYLAENFGKVLYVSSEEFASTTMTSKINEFLNPFPERLHFAENLKDPKLSDYDFIFMDSVNDLGLKIKEYREIRKAHPDTAFIFILQHTKSGDFKGGKDWEHIAEIAGEVSKGVVTVTKNRYAPKNSLDFFNRFGLTWRDPEKQQTVNEPSSPKPYPKSDEMVTTDNEQY